MARTRLTSSVKTQIEEAVQAYTKLQVEYTNLARQVRDHLADNARLNALLHSTKFRPKHPAHLRDKLVRQAHQRLERGKTFTVTAKNVCTRINDLAGVRLLYLHTHKMGEIHLAVKEVLDHRGYHLVRSPVAYTWDIENQSFFRSLGIRTILRDSMYTSVHYVLQPPWKGVYRCELQVRTLMEEVWGEVSHAIDYPQPTTSVACREQLKVLARLASAGTRLVDSIFASHSEHTAE